MKKLTLLSTLPVAALLSVIIFFVPLLYKYLHIAKLPSVKSLEFTGQRWYEQSFPINLSDHTQLFPHNTQVHYCLKPSVQRQDPVLKKILVACPNSPLSYPTQGLQVPPTQTILIPGLSVYADKRDIYTVTLSAKLGVLDTMAEVEEVTLEGLGESRLSLSSPHLENLNLQLRTVTYTNTVYQPGTSEMDGKISNLVTVVTKTFLRYDKLKGLITSIRKFYPDINIIVADDSEHIEMLHEPSVEQYIMPYGKGWFAGRNLAISQVMTKYLLWVDDDFLFSEKTKLERMVEVLEKNSLDVHVFKVVPGDSDGDCLHRTMSTYCRLDGFPTCSLVDMVVNFFLARTKNMRSVSFDPQFSRIGHPEFFIDGLGKLRVGTCRDISIDHAPKKENMAQYNRYHHAKEARSRTMRALFFKNYLVCYRT